jgi:hypothetical protein
MPHAYLAHPAEQIPRNEDGQQINTGQNSDGYECEDCET